MNRIKNFLLAFIQTQLIVTLVAIPLLVGWGLGFSLMTFVGNLIFTPLLMLTIMLSSLLFFTQLLTIPNEWLVSLFSLTTHTWDNILQWGNKNWMIVFAHPGIIPLALIPIITFLLLKHRSINTQAKRIAGMSVLLVLTYAGLWLYQKQTNIYCAKEFKSHGFSVFLVDQNHIKFVDHTFFNTKASVDKTVEFELKQTLVKHFGNRMIKELVLANPGQRSFAGAQQLCRHFTVKTVVIPFFTKKLTKYGWYCFFSLKRFLTEQKIELIRCKPEQIL